MGTSARNFILSIQRAAPTTVIAHKIRDKTNNTLADAGQESIQTKANRPLRDRNPNTYNLILKRPQYDLDLEMTLTLIILIL